jgi:hypothetical protein
MEKESPSYSVNYKSMTQIKGIEQKKPPLKQFRSGFKEAEGRQVDFFQTSNIKNPGVLAWIFCVGFPKSAWTIHR